MKKLVIALLTMAMLFSLAACGDKTPQSSTTEPTTTTTEPTTTTTTTQPALSGTLEEIIDKIYKNAAENAYSTDYASGDAMYTFEITEDRLEYFYGCTFEYEEAVASEYQMTPPAYSLSLIRLPAGADVESVKAQIKENANPWRWVCVGVEKVEVVSVGNIIGVFMMTEAGATALSNSFSALSGK